MITGPFGFLYLLSGWLSVRIFAVCLTALTSSAFADVEIYQTSYLTRVRIYPKGDKTVKTGYLRHPKQEFKITAEALVKDELPSTYVDNVEDFGFQLSARDFLIGDSVYGLSYNDTVLTHYLIGKMVSVAEIDSIVSDTALWGDWGGIEPWVDSATGSILKSSRVVFNDTIWVENGGYQFLHVVGLDSAWTRKRYRSLVKEEAFADLEAVPHREIIGKFDPAIQKAIKDHKLFFYTTWSP